MINSAAQIVSEIHKPYEPPAGIVSKAVEAVTTTDTEDPQFYRRGLPVVSFRSELPVAKRTCAS